MNTAIWWIRRDLRLSDNPALAAALEQAETVVPVFILDPKLLASPYCGEKRLAFLLEGLRVLDADLRRRGSSLVVRAGEPLACLHALRNESEAEGIFAAADVSPYARRRDERVGRELPLALTGGVTVHPPERLHKADGAPYTVYTPFSRMWRSLPDPARPLLAPERLAGLPPLASLNLPGSPRHPADSPFPAGEAEALRRLDEFRASGIGRYAGERDRMDLEGTSGLSPYLRFGMLSPRQAVWATMEAGARSGSDAGRRGAQTWLGELIWREFYAAILWHFPYVLRTAFRPALRGVRWRDEADADFQAWAAGRTGYPVVDAAMRQLLSTGWMHNRARMLAASFLTKDLLIDWRRGEQHFMQHLLDGDPASNNGGWQWTAGTGTDAAPYFRVFNPVLQGRRFDPRGEYVRHWLPELAGIPAEYLHAPWNMPPDLQRRAGCLIGKHYPAPLVDHKTARQRALAAYHQSKKYSSGEYQER